MGRPKIGISCLCAILCVSGAQVLAKTSDGPNSYLKNIFLVSYSLYAGPPKGACGVDWKAWNAAIDFVANQSVKLKLITDKEHSGRTKKLVADAGRESDNWVNQFYNKVIPNAAQRFDPASENELKYTNAPSLSFEVIILEHNNGCAGMLKAEVEAALMPSTMISTETFVGSPHMVIWSASNLLTSPPETFSQFVIQTSEQMMKSFVNDWSLSQ
jgi:hypothetical protein